MTALRSLLAGTLSGTLALAVAAVPTAASASSGHHDSPQDRLQREVDAVQAAGATGVLAEVQDGRHRVRASSGVAELGSNRPVPLDGTFRAGSVTKTFIATVVLQLVAEHRIGLNATVDRVLPGVLPSGTGITVRDLLDHRSGLQDVLTTFPRPGTPEFLALRTQSWTPAELIARVADKPLLFTPGSEAGYSNTNYMLLARIIERLTGRPYADTVEQRIIRPLALHHTWFPRATDPYVHGPHAHGYMQVQEPDGSTPVVDVTTFNPTIMWGGGEIISTTNDLNRFFDVLQDGRLLPAYLTKQLYATGKDSIYGLGLIKHRLGCDVDAWGKDGDAPGYSTWSFSTPDHHKRVTVSVTWGAGDSDDAVDDLLDAELCP